MLAPWPGEEIVLPGRTLHVRHAPTTGAGEPAVFVHGLHGDELEEARDRLRGLLPDLDRWTSLTGIAPLPGSFGRREGEGPSRASYVASTLSASLELVKEGKVAEAAATLGDSLGEADMKIAHHVGLLGGEVFGFTDVRG